VRPVFDWPDYSEALKWALESAKGDDWIVVDMIDSAWSGVQRYFVGEVFDKGMGEYFLNVRKQLQAASKSPRSIMQSAFRGWLDWAVINRLYEDWMLPIVHKTNCHLYLATKAQPVTAEDDPATKAVFGELGVRPSGQKHLGHQVHTCFLLTYDNKDTWYITTAKDRSKRSYFKKTKLTSLYLQYFVAKAGWPLPE